MAIEDDGFDGEPYTVPRWLIVTVGVVGAVLVSIGLVLDYLL